MRGRYQIITIKGITHKMKNRIQEHGPIWMVENKEDKRLMITPVNPIDHEFPYSTWVLVGIDIEIVEETQK